MKYKALAIVALLLLPLIPLATARQPPMPLWNVDVYTTPDQCFTAPCTVSTYFTIDLWMWNDGSLTNTSVYAFDIYVYWKNFVGISLTGHEFHMPWPEGVGQLIIEEHGNPAPWNSGLGFYHIAATATGDGSNALGNSTIFDASLATLTFHIDFEPCWGQVGWTTGFYIGTAVACDIPSVYPPVVIPDLSTGCTSKITNIELEVAEYTITASQPSIDLLVPETDPGYINATFFEEVTAGEVHTIEVNLNNVTGLFGYEFTLKYDPAYYTTDYQHVFLTQALPPPFETLQLNVDNITGVIHVKVMRPCEKPPVCAYGYLPIVNICFVGTPQLAQAGEIPTDINTYFVVTAAQVWMKCFTGEGQPYLYDPSMENYLFYSGGVTQLVRPKSPADLNWDGIVNIDDLVLIIDEYGESHLWSGLVDPSGFVDIYDIVFVAKHFGDP